MIDNNKVYIITKGSYSDYHICAATLDKNTAVKLAKKYSEDECGNAKIEEYILDDFTEGDRFMYCVTFGNYGISCGFEEYEHTENIVYRKNARTGEDRMIVYVKAQDEEHAKKIAQDIRAEYLAKLEGVTD
jgi:hypothetical protein